jgi:hypothetical protein
MPHKLVIMPKKTGGGGHYNFIFSQIMFYVRLRERQENLQEKPLVFSINKWYKIKQNLHFIRPSGNYSVLLRNPQS